MKDPSENYIYVYDEERHQIIMIDSETGEKVEKKDDRVTSILQYLRDEGHGTKLRKFAVWCSYQVNEDIKPIQNKLIELAERAIEGKAGREELQQLYDETEGAAIATDTVGLRQGSEKAPAFLTSRECINPDPYDAALQAARFHRLWVQMDNSESDKQKILREIRVSDSENYVQQAEQKQVDYLLELIGEK